MQQTIIDEQAIAQAELSAYIVLQAHEIAPDSADYEIDSIPDVFGELYRVWTRGGMQLAGTFYQRNDGVWKAQRIDCDYAMECGSEGDAIAIILG